MLCICPRNAIRTGCVYLKIMSASKASNSGFEDSQSGKDNKINKDVVPVLMPVNKVAVIAGGTGCIGMATAHELLTAKARHVALIDTDICNGKKAVEMLNCCHGKDKAMFVKADIRNKKEAKESFSIIKKDLSNIDIVVNAGGVWDEKNWEDQVGPEIIGALNVSLASLENLDKGGVLLNVCGVQGIINSPILSPYPIAAATSGAVVAFCRSLGHPKNYLKTGIRVLAMCVGITNTKYIKAVEQRTLRPDMSEDLKAFIRDSQWQKPDSCGRSILQLIQCAQTGTVWVAEGSQLFRVEIPDWKSCSSLQAQYV